MSFYGTLFGNPDKKRQAEMDSTAPDDEEEEEEEEPEEEEDDNSVTQAPTCPNKSCEGSTKPMTLAAVQNDNTQWYQCKYCGTVKYEG